MKEAYWGYWFIMLGVFIIAVMMFTQDATTSTTQDYYQLKEVANSAIYDSIDYAYYSQTKQVRMLKEVFVENFIRRFSETAALTDTYQIDFFDLYESPPKVSIKVTSATGDHNVGRQNTAVDVVNSIDIVVEFNPTITDSCPPEARPGDPAYAHCFKNVSGCEYYAPTTSNR